MKLRVAFMLCVIPVLAATQTQPALSPAQSADAGNKQTSAAATAEAVDIASEPHHKLLLDNGDMRVFRVEVGPKQSTLLHNHENDFLVVTLGDSTVAVSEAGSKTPKTLMLKEGDTRFTFFGNPLALRNQGESPYRNITVEFLWPSATTPDSSQTGGGTRVMPAAANPRSGFTQQMSVGQLLARDIQLLPGESIPAGKIAANTLLIAVNDVKLKADVAGAEAKLLSKNKGEVELFTEAQAGKITNVGEGPARLITVHLKQSESNLYSVPRKRMGQRLP